MTLLRIRCSLDAAPGHFPWTLVEDGSEAVCGEGTLEELPRGADRVQLLVPAAQVLITRALLPSAARRDAGSLLAYAVEDDTLGEPDSVNVIRLGSSGEADVLAVLDRAGLGRWIDALEAAGMPADEVCCETLLLPWAAGTWTLLWDGREGVLRSGELEGMATDCGDSESPPLSLRLMLEQAQLRGDRPEAIVLHAATTDAVPELDAWQRALGVELRLAASWDWRIAPAQACVSLAQRRQRWRIAPRLFARLRPAAWIAAAALAVLGIGLIADWTRLTREQLSLRQGMVARFRATFPEAVAVVDPQLQMRRKLAEARHAAGQPDRGDFLPMIEQLAQAAKELPAGAVRALAYESGRMTLELAATDEAGMRRIVARLAASGLSVDPLSEETRAAGATRVLIVRAS